MLCDKGFHDSFPKAQDSWGGAPRIALQNSNRDVTGGGRQGEGVRVRVTDASTAIEASTGCPDRFQVVRGAAELAGG